MSERLPPDPLEAYRDINLEDTLAHIGEAVYHAALEFEKLEDAGRITGNGHHMAQQLALDAQVKLLERWSSPDDIAGLDESHPALKELNQRLQLSD